MRANRCAFAALVAVALLGTVGVCGEASGQVELRLRLAQGESRYLWLDIQQTVSQGFQGAEQEFGFGYLFEVQAVDVDGTASIKVTYDAILFKMSGPMGQVLYDSADPPEIVPEPAAPIAGLLGESYTVTVTPLGKVVSVQGAADALVRAMEKAGLLEGPLKEQMQASLEQQFSDQAVQEMLESTFAVFPEQPVSVGDSWSKEVVTTGGLPAIVRSTYTLASCEGGLARIEAESTLAPNPDASPIEMGPVSVRYQISGTTKGPIELEVATGWITRARTEMDLAGEVVVEAPPGAPEMPGTPMSVTGVVTIERARPMPPSAG
jgi:hypothetical protein